MAFLVIGGMPNFAHLLCGTCIVVAMGMYDNSPYLLSVLAVYVYSPSGYGD